MSKKNKSLSVQRQPQKLFKPKMRRFKNSSAYLNRQTNRDITFDNFKDTNIFSENSYRYGDKKGLVSTQEINVDYSKLTNHTFFHSAVAKTNEYFDLVLNKYPYDGTNKEIEIFEDSLTGYEKYLLNLHPKNVGYLIFSGTVKGESQDNGTYIQTKEYSGGEFAELTSNKTAMGAINPGSKPFNIQLHLNIPKAVNDNQTIFQKYQTQAYNFGLYLSQSNSTEECQVHFIINSGSNSLVSQTTVPKGEFFHLTAEYHDCNQYSSIMTILESEVEKDVHTYVTSSNRVYFEKMSPVGDMLMGKGSTVRTPGLSFVPQETLSGSIDDFRIFHRTIKIPEIKKYYNRSVSGRDDLAVYFKFNEPFGVYDGNNIVLDSSRSGLTSKIQNYIDSYTRNTGSHATNPMSSELKVHNPVLFPDFELVKSFNDELIESAKDYDDYNPNLITKLIPPHYLDLGNEQDNFETIFGELVTSFAQRKEIQLKQSSPTGVQLLVKLLLSWAKTFDEIKIFIDHFSKVNFVEYDDFDTVSDRLLERLGNHLGLQLPRLFSSANIDQLLIGLDLRNNPAAGVQSLYQVQNLIWRRILSDIANIKQSKGSLDTIRSIFRSSGIEAENIFNFREYGGTRIRSLEGSRDVKKDVVGLLNFSGSAGNKTGDFNAQGYRSDSPYLKSGYLSGSRIETGKPEIRKTQATASISCNATTLSQYHNRTITITSTDGTVRAYRLDQSGAIGGATGTIKNLSGVDHVIVSVTSASSRDDVAAEIKLAIEHENGHSGKILVARTGKDLALTQRDASFNNNLASANTLITDTSAGSIIISGFSGGKGFDKTSNDFFHGLSTTTSDGLFTTSSFTVRGLYKFSGGEESHPKLQSLLRINITGSHSDSEKESTIVNIVAEKGKINAYISDDVSSTTINSMTLNINNLTGSVIDGDPWAISFSRKDGAENQSTYSDEYVLTAAKYSGGQRLLFATTSSFFEKKPNSVFSNISDHNTSGSFLVIGSQSLGSSTRFINNSSDENQKYTNFTGKVSYINFWSGHKDTKEFLGFAKNPNSVGAHNPAVNYNFTHKETGSFNRVRVQTYGKQATTSSDNLGNFRLFDFSQNDIHLDAKGFEPNKIVLTPYNYIYEILSENFDLNSTKDKIRIRSLQDVDAREDSEYALTAPAYEVPPLEEVTDDTRFSIDMSSMKGLNENIMTMFPDFQPIENALGQPNAIFGEFYYDLRAYRRSYFNNVLEDLDLGRYRTLFKWIDNSYTDLVYSLVPRTTNFMGINFIYESHVLERNRFKYLFDEIYLKAMPKDCGREPILLSQYVSKICKF